MLTTHPPRQILSPRVINCVSSNRDIRQMAHGFRPDVTTATVVPAEGIITIITPEGAFAFICGQGRGEWNLVMANVLVGLGFYRVTSEVPQHLIDPSEDRQSHVVVKTLG